MCCLTVDFAGAGYRLTFCSSVPRETLEAGYRRLFCSPIPWTVLAVGYRSGQKSGLYPVQAMAWVQERSEERFIPCSSNVTGTGAVRGAVYTLLNQYLGYRSGQKSDLYPVQVMSRVQEQSKGRFVPDSSNVAGIGAVRRVIYTRYAPFGIRPYGLLPHVRLRRIHPSRNACFCEQAPTHAFRLVCAWLN